MDQFFKFSFFMCWLLGGVYYIIYTLGSEYVLPSDIIE